MNVSNRVMGSKLFTKSYDEYPHHVESMVMKSLSASFWSCIEGFGIKTVC